jgi:hypothetical protein
MVNNSLVSPMRWLLIEDVNQLRNYIEQWKELAQLTNANVFCSPEWIITWVSVYWQPNWQLKTILGFENQKLIVLAPLYIQKSNDFFCISTLMPLGQGEPEESEVLSEFQDVLIHPLKKNLYSQLAIQIKKIPWDNCRWNALLHTSHWIRIIQYFQHSKCKEIGLRYLLSKHENYLSTLSKNKRNKWNRSKNKLSVLNSKFIWVDHADHKQYLQKLTSFHQLRWTKKNESGAFCSSEFINFHHSFQATQKTKMSALLINDEPVAINYYLQDESTLYFYQCGWDESNYANLSPGFALHVWSILNNPFKFYDFMMAGKNDNYKNSFNCSKIQPMFRATINSSFTKNVINYIINKIKA